MLVFCPTCGNMLLVELEGGGGGPLRYACQTCPYVQAITGTVRARAKLAPKVVEDVFDDERVWANAQRTNQAVCPACRGPDAFFAEMQTRSADEPATVFYRCAARGCGRVWTEN